MSGLIRREKSIARDGIIHILLLLSSSSSFTFLQGICNYINLPGTNHVPGLYIRLHIFSGYNKLYMQ